MKYVGYGHCRPTPMATSFWSGAGSPRPCHDSFSSFPATNPISDTLSKDLKRRRFRFVGSTIIYAYMQAVGLVNDHTRTCFLSKRPFRDSTCL
ncbi:MAG: DNA-3-methyladenine glycosylase I [Nitrospiraceae bacterium]|uniref:DNA-3-methyladenine glycosylase I n=1 Tax=Nitrospira cf. moscoviensis SBR1015 TaxID=96242 RepID=UPI000B3BB082|nr:DNA-3-methyladenine glycosylase I [Nitrospira cf. moscoviensis SBR1015]MBY0247092.1 DNA-3-methyladenine glycosylase I [Nitrospiraceae bacterium]